MFGHDDGCMFRQVFPSADLIFKSAGFVQQPETNLGPGVGHLAARAEGQQHANAEHRNGEEDGVEQQQQEKQD